MPLSINRETLRIGRFTSSTVKPTRSSSFFVLLCSETKASWLHANKNASPALERLRLEKLKESKAKAKLLHLLPTFNRLVVHRTVPKAEQSPPSAPTIPCFLHVPDVQSRAHVLHPTRIVAVARTSLSLRIQSASSVQQCRLHGTTFKQQHAEVRLSCGTSVG